MNGTQSEEPRASLAFAESHIDSILAENKSLTARYDFEREFSEGAYIRLTDSDRHLFAIARVTKVANMSISDFVSERFQGHRTYDSVSDCCSHMETYYPDAHLTGETRLTVIWFEVVQNTLD